MSEEHDAFVRGLDPRVLKTSDLVLQFVILRMRGGLGDGLTNRVLHDKVRELADEIDRRLPGP